MIIGLSSSGQLYLHQLARIDRSSFVPPSHRELTGDPIKDDWIWDNGGISITREDALDAIRSQKLAKHYLANGKRGTAIERQQAFSAMQKWLDGATGRILPDEP